ncbi:MAG: amino acid adenylation domain-containing protein, partial [Jatrophihabitantaceae bacterium]
RGRSDNQIKIHGIRVDTTEITNQLSTHPYVAQALVTAARTRSSASRLVAYLVPTPDAANAPGELDLSKDLSPHALRRFLATALPDFMIPAEFMVLDEFPLDANGKVDRPALPAPLAPTTAFRLPSGATELALAGVFAGVLGVDELGADDDFFAVGGDSIRSIQIVSQARQRGIQLTARDIFEQRTVSDLAKLVDGRAGAPQQLVEPERHGIGWAPAMPMAHYLAELGGGDRFAMSVVLDLPKGVEAEPLTSAIGALLAHHDVLRSATRAGGLQIAGADAVDAAKLLRRVSWQRPWDDQWQAVAAIELDDALSRLRPTNGVMTQWIWFDAGPERAGRLLIVCHHHVVDGVSWRVLLPDLAQAYQQAQAGERPRLAPVGTSARRWAQGLREAAHDPAIEAEVPFWRSMLIASEPLLGARAFDPALDRSETVRRSWVTLPSAVTDTLLGTVPASLGGGPNEVWLTALALAMSAWRQRNGVSDSSTLVRLEGHGREEQLVPGAELSRTVGWFTSMFPVRLDLGDLDVAAALAGNGDGCRAAHSAIAGQLSAIPNKGMGFGLLRYLNDRTRTQLDGFSTGQISFNYLGRFGAARSAGADWTLSQDTDELVSSALVDLPALSSLEINVAVRDTSTGPELSAVFGAPAGLLDPDSVSELAELWCAALRALAAEVARAPHREPAAALPSAAAQQLVPAQPPAGELLAWRERYPNVVAAYPATSLQAGLLFESQLARDSFDAYQVQVVYQLAGQLDVDRLAAAAQQLVDRHEILRTAFVTGADGEMLQLVLADAELPWRTVELTGLAATEQRTAVAELLAADLADRFDPARAPLIRLSLVRTALDTAELVLSAHHAVLDGWSMGILLTELLALYRGEQLPSAPAYQDFLRWLAGLDPQASAAAWSDELAGVEEPTLVAPVAGAGVARQQTVQHVVPLTANVARTLGHRAAELGLTLNTVVQAAWAVTLAGLTGKPDVLFGSTVSGRPPEVAGVESMVGLFINTVPVRVRLRPWDSLSTVMTELHARQNGLIDHRHRSLVELQSGTGLRTLFDTVTVFESVPLGLSSSDELAVTGVRTSGGTHYPIGVAAAATPQLSVVLHVESGAVEPALADRAIAALAAVLGQIAADPGVPVGQLDLIGAAERDRLVAEGNGGPVQLGRDIEAGTVPELFAEQLTRTPDAIAIRSGEAAWSYRELDARADQLARRLAARAVGPETVVAVSLPRSAELVVAMLAVLKAGGAYLPVDAAYPSERIAQLIEDAQVRLAVVDASTAAAFEGLPGERLAVDATDTATDAIHRPATLDNAAYVIYTSGSTGRPKGVAVTHRGIASLVHAHAERLAIGPDSRMLQLFSPSFDVSICEMLITLLRGGCVVLEPNSELVLGATLAATLERHQVSHLQMTPTMLAEMPAGSMATVTSLVLGGEAPPPELVSAWSPGRRLVNVYGPTEATVVTTMSELLDAPAGPVPIGRPIANAQVYVLDSWLQPVANGVEGELYIGGSGIARGYLGRPALSAERFVACPFQEGGRMYRSGDLVVRDADGTLTFTGRADDQIKVRGFRIEPREVEAALLASGLVGQAAVITQGSGGDRHLVGYLVPTVAAADEPAVPDGLREHLQRTLPAHLVPSVLIALDRIPMTASGKLDRQALPDVDGGQQPVGRAASTGQQRLLCGLFGEILGRDQVSIDDDFFELGGHSIRAARLVARVRAVLGVELALAAVFESPTVAELAERLPAGGLGQPAGEVADPFGPLLVIRDEPAATGEPIWFIHSGGGLCWPYLGFAPLLPAGRPIYGIQARGFQAGAELPASIAEVVEDYTNQLRTIQPSGPYYLAGYSIGGTLAHAIAARLQRDGQVVALLALLDSAPADRLVADSAPTPAALREYFDQQLDGAVDAGYEFLIDKAVELVGNLTAQLPAYHSPVYHGDALLVRAIEDAQSPQAQWWQGFITGAVHEHPLPTVHADLCSAESAPEICRVLTASIQQSTTGDRS